MTFQESARAIKIGGAFGRIKHGEKVIDAAFESGYESLSGFAESFKKATGFPPNKSRISRVIMITRIPTPLGPMLAGADDEGISLFEFVDRKMLPTQLKRLSKSMQADLIPGSSPHFDTLNRQMLEYFNGTRKKFTFPLVISGTAFQKKVWEVLQQIPYGATRSYKEQAIALGNPKAVRAVARANGDNKIAIIIPCHRVVGASGELVGYGGGLERKRFLLDLEARNS
jgi:AraC family transcriptional regulator of adaptative response/methylated-DNA-[protein]-cysteine methyltransferase